MGKIEHNVWKQQETIALRRTPSYWLALNPCMTLHACVIYFSLSVCSHCIKVVVLGQNKCENVRKYKNGIKHIVKYKYYI